MSKVKRLELALCWIGMHCPSIYIQPKDENLRVAHDDLLYCLRAIKDITRHVKGRQKMNKPTKKQLVAALEKIVKQTKGGGSANEILAQIQHTAQIALQPVEPVPV